MNEIKETIKEAFGYGPKVRYAVVGVGDISQAAFMPGVKHTHNSELTALITSDPVKAEEVAKQYDIKYTYKYEQFDEFIRAKVADAIYLATPNWRHLEFAVPALKAGLHVLLEKPMEIDVQKCMEIIEAQKSSGAKLMIAYRLHFEPATIAALERVRSGELGQVHMFNSIFCQNLDPKNHRALNGVHGGPIFDMGTYPLNAVRNLFECEPIEVFAMGTRHPEAGFPNDFDDTVAVTLRFPGNRVAQFIVSYYGGAVDDYTVTGPKGSLRVSPGFTYGKQLGFDFVKQDGSEKREEFKQTDHFGGELKYFSDCILKGLDPEPDGLEGLLDVRVLHAVVRSLETKTAQTLDPYTRTKAICRSQEQQLNDVKVTKEIHSASPARQST